jgi:hypothetical protein
MVRLSALFTACAWLLAAQTPTIETRGQAAWPTANHFRFTVERPLPKGRPILQRVQVPAAFNPDSVRVMAGTSRVPVKVEWQTPHASIGWVSTGAPSYEVYFDIGREGETARQTAPAMVGTGDRMTYGRPDVRGPLAVGLWAHPAALDFDGDGNLDLLVGCADRPYNGIYLFHNLGTNAQPLFDRAEWLGPGGKDLVAADFNGDGRIDLVVSGGYYSDVRAHRLSRFVKVALPRTYHVGRDDLWNPVDWDGDGRIDVLVGTSDWRDYGWDDAYNARGEWTRGPIHGYVYWHRNTGSNEAPVWAEPVRLPFDLRGSPAPNPVDWFGTGKFDLIGGDFVDTVTLFRNIGSRQEPRLDAGRKLTVDGRELRMELCMIQPRVVQWDADGRPSLLIGEEDGTVSLLENLAPKGTEPRLAAPRRLQQVDPLLKSGALSRPVAFDWNGDGKLDLIAGNSAGYIEYFENTGTRASPAFTARGNLQAGGKTIRVIAGPNGSVQGPIEEKWGYSNPSVADWDLDGRPDILVNDIWGAVVWYRNTGTRTAPVLEAARPVDVEWEGAPPKPEWVWWTPKGKQLVTQWRTTPKVVDWDGDGLPDLVMLDYRGYLTLYRRARRDGKLALLPPERIFVEPGGRFLLLATGRAGGSGRRKIELVDWDGDGDLDLITDSNDGPIWYENIGSQARPVMRLRGAVIDRKLQGHNPTANAADWNGDGRLDLIVGAEDGHFYYFDRNFLEGK